MKDKIEQVLIKVDEGTMPVQQALTELLVIFSVVRPVSDFVEHLSDNYGIEISDMIVQDYLKYRAVGGELLGNEAMAKGVRVGLCDCDEFHGWDELGFCKKCRRQP